MRKQAGFNLIELLIVIAIIGVLGSIGYSSYKGYVVEARRANATNYLLHLVQVQEKYYLDNQQYAGTLALLGGETETGDGMYSISMSTSNNGQDFSVTATAKTGTPQIGDADCTTLSTNSSNQRTPGGKGCW